DISTASTKYRNTRQQERSALEKQLTETAPAAARALLTQWKHAGESRSRAEKKLERMGYRIATYSTPAQLTTLAGKIKKLVLFDEETARIEKKILDLKRDFTLRLFAGGEEARGLFHALTKELAGTLRSAQR